jgi:hypothetical protein
MFEVFTNGTNDIFHLCWLIGQKVRVFCQASLIFTSKVGSAIYNGREPKSCLGQVFNSKLDRIAILCSKCVA